MRNWLVALLGVFVIEFIIAPFGGRVFNYFFPEGRGLAGMVPDVPFYQWGYASVFAVGFVLGVAFARWQMVRAQPQGLFAADRSAAAHTNRAFATPISDESSSDDDEPKEQLMMFVITRMLPTCNAQADLQDAIGTKRFGHNKFMQRTVLQGIRQDERISAFWSSYRRLQDAFGSSPPDDVPFGELMDCVAAIEKGYGAFCRETNELARGTFRDDLARLRREWHDKHALMVEEYEAIKLNPKMRKLFRPMRPSRWRDVPESMLAQEDQSSTSRTV